MSQEILEMSQLMEEIDQLRRRVAELEEQTKSTARPKLDPPLQTSTPNLQKAASDKEPLALANHIQALLESTGEGIFGLDLAGNCTFINPAGAATLGFTQNELLGQNIHTIIQHTRNDGTPYPQEECPIWTASRDGQPRRVEDERFWRKDGSAFIAAYSSHPIIEGQEIKGSVVTFRDISQRKQAEEERRFLMEASTVLASSLDYRQTLRSLGKLILPQLADWYSVATVEEDGSLAFIEVAHKDATKVHLARELMERYPLDPDTDYGIPHVLRTGRSDLVPEIADALLESIAADEEHLQLLRTLGLKSSMVIPLSARGKNLGVITFVSAESRRYYTQNDLQLAEELARRAAIAIDNARLFDQTQKLNAELEQRVQLRTVELETAMKELESFSYSVSHDLRAPLRSMDGFSLALLEDYSDKLDAEGQDYLHRVRTASQRMAQLIDDLLQLSRVTRTELRQEPVNLSELAQSIISQLQQEDSQRPVSIVIADQLIVEGDPRLLQLVLDNLLGNAWKFTSKQQGAQIEFGCEEKDGQHVYYVRDNGAGFDMAYRGKLFGPFQRLHSDAEFTGSGIGLATVQRIIRRHGGQIWAEGAVNKGATFYFTLAT